MYIVIKPGLHVRQIARRTTSIPINEILTSSFMALTPKVVFRTRVKYDNDSSVSQAETCECSYACDNDLFAQRQKYTDVHASDETRRRGEGINPG